MRPRCRSGAPRPNAARTWAAGVLLAGALLTPGTANAWDGTSLGGYASPFSVPQGGTVEFHVSTDRTPIDLTVWREGAVRQLARTIPALPVSDAPLDCTGLYAAGCGWPAVATLTVPSSWPSGIYTVDVPTTARGAQHIVFWVREDNPGSTAKVLFVSAANTYQAYTSFGGKSLYDEAAWGAKAPKVSFARPFDAAGLGDLALELPFVAWAEGQDFVLEFAADADLELVPGLLAAYDVLVVAGHSEYWSRAMRDEVRALLARGGRLINLSGNTMWWQVRFEDGGRTLVAAKEYALEDAALRDDPRLATLKPWDYPVFDPEAALLGVEWMSGGYFNSPPTETGGDIGTIPRHADGYGGFWVHRPDHWVFAGTGLAAGDVFGRTDAPATSVIGRENDGAYFNCGPDGRTVLGSPANGGTPANFTVLATAPVEGEDGDRGFAVTGLYTLAGGGAVFSGSTMNWAAALADSRNAALARVTRNVLERFIAGDVPAEPPSAEGAPLFQDRFNCDALWYGAPGGVPGHNYFNFAGALVRLSEACGYAGAGLEITLDPADYVRFRSRLLPDWGGTDTLYGRLYVDLAGVVMADNDEFQIMAQSHDDRVPLEEKGWTSNRVDQMTLRIRKISGAVHATYREEKSGGASTGWVPLPGAGPVLLETEWDRAGSRFALWVNGVRHQPPGGGVDLSAHLPMTRVDFGVYYLDAGTSGRLCLDEVAFDTARLGPLPNEAPVAGDLAIDTDEDEAVSVTLSATDPDGNKIGYEVVSGPTHGSLEGTAPAMTYRPAEDFAGTDSFIYRASDGRTSSAEAVVSIGVAPVNDPPAFTKGPDQWAFENDGLQTVSGWATGISPGPANESGQALAFLVSADSPALFSTPPAVSAAGTLTYAPAPGAAGSTTVTVRLRDDGGSASGGGDTSAAQSFTITIGPLEVTAPSAGERWTQGSVHTVTWKAPVSSGSVQVRLYQGTALKATLNASTPNDGAFTWTVPAKLAPGAYTLQVVWLGNSAVFGSSASFMVVSPTLAVYQPADGAVLRKGRQYRVTWGGVPRTGEVAIRLYQRAVLKATVIRSTPNDGSFSWTVPALLVPGAYTLRVVWLSNPAISGACSITIRSPMLAVQQPADGALLQQGKQYQVAWGGVPRTGGVAIRLYQGTALKATVSRSTPNDGAFNWTVPVTLPAGAYTLRVVWLSNPAIFGASAVTVVPAATTRVRRPSQRGGSPASARGISPA